MAAVVDPVWWTSGLWEGQPIRESLRRRDVTTIFRFLHARGLSYVAIAGAVGISPNRAAEITKGVRQVAAYDVLERIAVGLHIPRAAMGLGHEAEPTQRRASHEPGCDQDVSEPGGTAECHCGRGGVRDRTVWARLRADLDEALASSSVSPRQLELIEESTDHHIQVYPATSSAAMLSRLAGDCVDVLTLSQRRQPARVQARLSGAAALLATMHADALMRLGEVEDARLWYRTASHAAHDSGQTQLRVLVRAQAAMLPYYYGDAHQTVSIAEQALAIPGPPSPSRALAAAGRARALARTGAGPAARTAIDQARRLFDEVGDPDSDAAFRFPAKRLMLYLSGATTWLGDTTVAYRFQDEALRLYGATPAAPIDPVLVALDRSMCLVYDHRVAEAAATAREVIAGLPDGHRTEILLTRASDIAAAVPPAERCGEVTALLEYVQACREHADRTLVAVTAGLGS